jgi:hypothetical protein
LVVTTLALRSAPALPKKILGLGGSSQEELPPTGRGTGLESASKCLLSSQISWHLAAGFLLVWEKLPLVFLY